MRAKKMSNEPSKSKRFRTFWSETIGRSSSRLSASTMPPHLPPSLLSPPGELNVAVTAVNTSGAPNNLPSTVKRPTTSNLASDPLALSAIPSNLQTSLPPTNEPPSLSEIIPAVTSDPWNRLRVSLQGLGRAPGVFPHRASAAGILFECFERVEMAARNQQDYEELARELADLVQSIAEHTKESTALLMTKCISGITMWVVSSPIMLEIYTADREIKQQAKEIQNRRTQAIAGRLPVVKEDEEDVMRRYRQIRSLFIQLQTNLSVSTWSIANAQLVNTLLEGLNPVKQAAYDSALASTVSRRPCTEGTRTEVLSNLDKWLHKPNAPAVYWMNGMAGTGKTTIAVTFSEALEQGKQLAASFFCTRTTPDCRQATKIIPTIAYQLARYSAPFQSSLCGILGDEPDLGSKNIEKQFERLLRDPLVAEGVKDTIPGKLVVVIDALDECEDCAGVEIILEMLFRHAKDMPLRFFVTSRPEPEIYRRMMLDPKFREAMHLHDIEATLVQADIELYLKEELEFMSPTSSQIEELAERSGSLFIYAATLVRYVRLGVRFADPQKRLQSVLSLTPESTKRHAEIDALYTAILNSALEESRMEEKEAEDVKLVLRTVLFAQEPISVETIAALSGIDDPQQVTFALQPLRSVLHQSEETKLVSTLHASFPDFMLSSDRSKSFFCDIISHSQLLAERCFAAMKEQLRFNICELESSFVPDENVDNLEGRIQQNISPVLAYACRYWGIHLALAPESDNLMVMLEKFVSRRLLFWMEVLSLRRELAIGLETMLKANLWLNRARSPFPGLALLVEDSRNFVTGFASISALRSTPHIYISLLPFCPRSSAVFKNYWKRTRGLLDLKGSLLEHREGAALATWSVGEGVYSIEQSPDGARVAIACTDSTSPIAFSPDGKFVATGSSDATVRIWNAYNGTLIAGPMEGHTSAVMSVFFSPDGKLLVSGSADKTIRIWSADNGILLLDPLEGHEGIIYSIAISPDSTIIASAAEDWTVRLWNLSDIAPAASLLEGHVGSVQSVRFTPDGTRLVSGSDDGTIRIWNIPDGSLFATPFEFIDPTDGHISAVKSVAVSPDGTRIAAGGSGCIVQVWRIDDGTLVAGPFIGHTSWILSVAFSLDGTRVFSGGLDYTVRVWGMRNGLPASLPELDSFITNISSIMFSSDSTRIISSSTSKILGIWDIKNGTVATGPVEGQFLLHAPATLSPNGAYILSHARDHDIQVLSALDCSLVAGPFGVYLSPPPVQFTPDSKSIVIGYGDGHIEIQDLHQGGSAVRSFHGHNYQLTSIALSPDGTYIATYCGREDRLQVWNILTPTLEISTPKDSEPSDGESFEGWRVQEDGWAVNQRGDLLLWMPPDIATLRPSHYTMLTVTKQGTLIFPEQELSVGRQWTQCFV
ncbi:unnamed protein product [Rhizoctonia solani]|uniref:NACHT domain-containing protein n=1 Tax=Rhizoctonia solani TaxID=456999 RepID=A0A8H3HLB8_9AGAM|nr:unnamed protein product [Rhizoctonia solani]